MRAMRRDVSPAASSATWAWPRSESQPPSSDSREGWPYSASPWRVTRSVAGQCRSLMPAAYAAAGAVGPWRSGEGDDPQEPRSLGAHRVPGRAEVAAGVDEGGVGGQLLAHGAGEDPLQVRRDV